MQNFPELGHQFRGVGVCVLGGGGVWQIYYSAKKQMMTWSFRSSQIVVYQQQNVAVQQWHDIHSSDVIIRNILERHRFVNLSLNLFQI